MSRAGYFWVSYFMLWLVGLTWILRPSPHLIWNASTSVPTGLYAVAGIDALKRGDLVAVMPPKALAGYMAERFYLPLGLPLIKHVGALPGDTVCREGLLISINHRVVAVARVSDHARRPLLVWDGCRTVAGNEVFLLNADVQDSFDGRYFGVLPMSSVLGRTVPLWTDTHKRTP